MVAPALLGQERVDHPGDDRGVSQIREPPSAGRETHAGPARSQLSRSSAVSRSIRGPECRTRAHGERPDAACKASPDPKRQALHPVDVGQSLTDESPSRARGRPLSSRPRRGARSRPDRLEIPCSTGRATSWIASASGVVHVTAAIGRAPAARRSPGRRAPASGTVGIEVVVADLPAAADDRAGREVEPGDAAPDLHLLPPGQPPAPLEAGVLQHDADVLERSVEIGGGGEAEAEPDQVAGRRHRARGCRSPAGPRGSRGRTSTSYSSSVVSRFCSRTESRSR